MNSLLSSFYSSEEFLDILFRNAFFPNGVISVQILGFNVMFI